MKFLLFFIISNFSLAQAACPPESDRVETVLKMMELKGFDFKKDAQGRRSLASTKAVLGASMFVGTATFAILKHFDVKRGGEVIYDGHLSKFSKAELERVKGVRNVLAIAAIIGAHAALGGFADEKINEAALQSYLKADGKRYEKLESVLGMTPDKRCLMIQDLAKDAEFIQDLKSLTAVLETVAKESPAKK